MFAFSRTSILLIIREIRLSTIFVHDIDNKNQGAIMAKRKRGRPPLPKAERKRGVLGFRARDDLRQWLTDDAKLSGRSVSEEIEHRLEQSFEIADSFRAAFGETNGDLMRAIATVIWLIERRTGKKWNEDNFTAIEVGVAIDGIVRALTNPKRAAFHLRKARHPPSHERD